MSSPPKENLKAGHPPAVKVSGMRVVQHSHNHSEKLTKEEREKEEVEFQTEKPVNESLVVGGAITKGDKDFSTAAVKVAHEKPMPSKEKHQKGWSAHGHPNIVLMQPGKQ
ncbi:death-associated protein 1 [Hydra vulgaris]|uniref:Death-associated protein 1 n=1 Tax=Hydra vulgaris TaxID=6087 RepID=T2MEV3_HYDVU|nr:death-associated protein 1 [Hydra vulgaris]